jgi:chemosensory pili system protein ChpA (sensor histidine kinase/response regulator)
MGISSHHSVLWGQGSVIENVTSDPAVVLIVEDDPLTAEVIAEVVATAGYRLVVAANGQDALERIAEQWPDLVLCDLRMPYLDGGGLIRALRVTSAVRGQAMPPVILLSGAASTAANEVGVHAYLPKPFHQAELEALLGQFLPG